MKRKDWKNVVKSSSNFYKVVKPKKRTKDFGTKPGQGGLPSMAFVATTGDFGVSESAADVPLYHYEKAVQMLTQGYKLEVYLAPDRSKSTTKIISSDGKSVLGRVDIETRNRLFDKLPLKVIHKEQYRAIWSYDYSAKNESVETAFWDMPFIKEILGYDPMNKFAEDEEVSNKDKSPINDELTDELVDKIISLKDKKLSPEQKEAEVEKIVDELATDATGEPEDPDKMGLIRFVKGAHLVFKRQAEDGTYEELWIYQIDRHNSGSKIKKAILAGTDIDLDTEQSEDGKQSCEMWTVGNAQMVKIEGLPN